jgi:hypothetical protein
MRKLVLLVAALAFAATTMTAEAATRAKKAAQPVSPDAALAGYYDNTGRFVRDALPVFLPTWSMPIYMGIAADNSTHGRAAAKKAKKR